MLACRPTAAPRVEVKEAAATEASQSLAAQTEAAPAEEPPPPPATFEFADDTGGKILSRILPPNEPAKMPADAKTGPLARTRPGALERPDVPANPPVKALPKLPPAARSSLRPHLPAEKDPLAGGGAEIDVPRRPELPESGLIRTPSRDVNLPIDLPIQSRYTADRAPLDDATAEFSLEQAVRRPQPLRETPAPFVRINLPEPFENRASVKTAVPEPGVAAPTPMPPK
jgi:hypothetical protein